MAVKKEILVDKEAPTFDYFSAKNFAKLEEKTENLDKELDRFKNDYSSTRLNKVYEKYELLEDEVESKPETISAAKSSFEFNKIIKEQNSFNEVEESLTYQKVERDPKVEIDLNSRAKLAVFTYSFITLMLGFLLVYNAFAIGDITSNINSINENITSESVKIEKVIKDIGNMTDEDNILNMATDLSFNEVPMGSVINVTLYEKNIVPDYQGQTNWFDTICKFFNGIFGG